MSDGTVAHIPIPSVGFNPGNSLSGLFATLPVSVKYNAATVQVATQYAEEEHENSSPGSRVERYWDAMDNMFATAVVDDVKTYGRPDLCNNLTYTFLKSLVSTGHGGLAPGKSTIQNMGGEFLGDVRTEGGGKNGAREPRRVGIVQRQ